MEVECMRVTVAPLADDHDTTARKTFKVGISVVVEHSHCANSGVGWHGAACQSGVSARGSCRHSANGSVNTTSVPCPYSLSSRMLPPCASTMPRAIGKPSPAPWRRAVSSTRAL